MEEIEQHGHYPTTDRFNNLDWVRYAELTPIPNNQENPYVDAFWQWWPELYTSLEHFRITGGEPLLNKNTFRVLDYIIENPNPKINISINTNLCPPPELLDRFLKQVKHIVDNRLVKTFTIYTSAEAHGAQAEYIRHGMNYQQWIANMTRVFAEIPDILMTIMSTYNALSVPSYLRFLQDILLMKRLAYRPDGHEHLALDIPYLRNPRHQAMFILPKNFQDTIKTHVDFITENQTTDRNSAKTRGFNRHELEKMTRVYELFKNYQSDAGQQTDRQNFVKYVDEHDRRRDTNFIGTFPELAEFYNIVKGTL
jgi:hypothetical protein